MVDEHWTMLPLGNSRSRVGARTDIEEGWYYERSMVLTVSRVADLAPAC